MIENVRLMAENQAACTARGTDAPQAIWCFYLYKPHDVSNPQNVSREQTQKCQKIELLNTLVLVNKPFQEYVLNGPKYVLQKVHIMGSILFSQQSI